MSSLCVKFQPSRTPPPSDRFWRGVVFLVLLVLLVLLLVLVVVLVTGVKQSQLLVLRLILEFDNNLTGTWWNDLCNICCVYANIFLPLTQFCKYISLVEEKDDTGIKEHFAVGNHVEQLENKEDKKNVFFVIIGFREGSQKKKNYESSDICQTVGR